MALLAIFDTQVLSIFRRKKEMGTLMALGMPRANIIGLFTLEGAMHGLLAFGLGAVYGITTVDVFGSQGLYAASHGGQYRTCHIGYHLPCLRDRAGCRHHIAGINHRHHCQLLPTRKISKLKPTDAFKRKNLMIRFLFKGLLRDRNRSIFPLLIVMGGVMATVLFYCWIFGVSVMSPKISAVMDTGHVKIMTRAYREIAGQMPNDLSLPGIRELITVLSHDYPEMDWVPRIKFGGLLDFRTNTVKPVPRGLPQAWLLICLNPKSSEVKRLNLQQALVQGRLPKAPGELLSANSSQRNWA